MHRWVGALSEKPPSGSCPAELVGQARIIDRLNALRQALAADDGGRQLGDHSSDLIAWMAATATNAAQAQITVTRIQTGRGLFVRGAGSIRGDQLSRSGSARRS